MGTRLDSQVNQLMATGNLEEGDLEQLLKFRSAETMEYLFEMAAMIRKKNQKEAVEIWGRIPISNYCKYDCKMCGLRRGNQFARRYRLNVQQILKYCRDFEKKGVHTFLLESGDDVFFSEMQMAEVILAIKKQFPKAKLMLSLGEKPPKAYRHWRQIGAEGYFLSYGTADEQHFRKIYPSNMSFLLRKQCLWELRQAGYQTGTGFLVGIPYQKLGTVIKNIYFIKGFGADMIDIGAFIPAMHTPFEKEPRGNIEMVLYVIAILRLMLPKATIVSGRNLDCIIRDGRIRALSAGADVVVADVKDVDLMKKYCVYEQKNGRLALPVDSVSEIQKKLLVMGYRPGA